MGNQKAVNLRSFQLINCNQSDSSWSISCKQRIVFALRPVCGGIRLLLKRPNVRNIFRDGGAN